MKVLLISPPLSFASQASRQCSVPLGLAYIAALLEKNGHVVQIIDAAVEDFDNERILNDGTIIVGLETSEIKRRIESFSPEVIGISVMFSYMSDAVYELSEMISETMPQIKIVLGGGHATSNAEEMISNFPVDYIVKGEGEYAMLELVDHLDGNREIENVRSLIWKSEAGETSSNPQKFIADLDQLPFPARHLIKMEKYIDIGKHRGLDYLNNKRVTTMITSRGCPAKCVFCSIHPIWGRPFRAHSPEYILGELSILKNDFGITHIMFEDDNLTFEKNRAIKIFEGMVEKKLDLKWLTPNGIALWRLDNEVLPLMKKSGCIHLFLAFESGVQETLTKIIKKPLRLDKVKNIPSLCKKLKIKTSGFFVVGFPNESLSAINATLDYAVRSDLDEIVLMAATPYVGTPLYDQCVRDGLIDSLSLDDKQSTRTSTITTKEFTPELLSKLIKRAKLSHMLRHPIMTAKRLCEGILADPKQAMRLVGNYIPIPSAFKH